MKYLWTEDRGAGLHYWQLANQYMFSGELVVESKGSNQGILDVVNKLLELQKLAAKHPGQIIILDMICFEYIIFSKQP